MRNTQDSKKAGHRRLPICPLQALPANLEFAIQGWLSYGPVNY